MMTPKSSTFSKITEASTVRCKGTRPDQIEQKAYTAQGKVHFLQKTSTNGGFTLVEISISMVIISLILAMGAVLIPRLAFQFQENGSYDRMQVIHRALSSYAQKYNRIPCPAEPDPVVVTQPYGTERGSGAAGQNAGSCTTQALRHGIIPFRTLGLNFEDIHDSFGNLITYRVSRTPTLVPNPASDRINQLCRISPKWHNGVTDIDPEKAAFCCGHLPSNSIAWLNNDITVEGPFGALPQSARNIANYGGTTGEYGQSGTAAPSAATLQNDFKPSFAAYALISHGANGFGSYTNRGGQNTGLWRSTREQDNANRNQRRTYVQDNTVDIPNAGDPGTGQKVPMDRSQIDDIVSWRTPFQLYAETGNASCMEAR